MFGGRGGGGGWGKKDFFLFKYGVNLQLKNGYLEHLEGGGKVFFPFLKKPKGFMLKPFKLIKFSDFFKKKGPNLKKKIG